jgi:Cu+-exporting ATPase
MEHSHCAHCDISAKLNAANYHALIRQTTVAISVGIALFIAAIFKWIPAPNTANGYWINVGCAIVTLAVLVYSGGHFFSNSWCALRAKRFSRDILVAVALSICWLYSLFALVFIHNLTSLAQQFYFETTVIIITIVNLGLISEYYYCKNINIAANSADNDIVSIVNIIAAMLIPSVIFISGLSAVIWYFIGLQPILKHIIMSSTAVLLIASPCALRLAVLTSITAGIDKALQQGILIHDAKVLRNIAKINTVILNKSGIITLGNPKVTEITAVTGINPNQVLSIATSLESESKHPYALAIMAAAKERLLNVEAISDRQNFPGLGINGIINGESSCIGNRAFMEAQLVKIDTLRDNAKKIATTGATVLYVASNKQLIGLITLAVPIKPETKFIVQKLHDMQMRVIMITGDQQLTAVAIANQVGITEVIADAMPQEKATKISELQRDDAIVAMVVDIINDAPALTQADVSITMGPATDIATKPADVILSNGSLENILETIYISNVTIDNMKQNLVGAFIYNIVGIPIAAGILFPFTGLLLSPILAAAAMACSSLAVIANANRLVSLQRSLAA